MPLDFAISALLTLFVVVDPVGLVPAFLLVTEGLPAAARRSVALRASMIGGAILIGAALLGDWLFRTLGISLSAFRIAGGLLLFSIASEMVFGVRLRRESEVAEEAVEERAHNVAAFPLAIPLMAGPGAITATVLLAGRADGNMLLTGLLIAVVVSGRDRVLCRFVSAAADQPAARYDRQHRPLAPAWRAARRARGAIRGRRHSRHSRRMKRHRRPLIRR